MYEIEFIRHGESIANVDPFFHWMTLDPELTKHGIHQCIELKQKLKDVKYDYIFCSPLRRSIQTTLIIFPGKIIKCLDCLTECGFGFDNIKLPVTQLNFFDSFILNVKNKESIQEYIMNNCKANSKIAIICHENRIKKVTNIKRKINNCEVVKHYL